MDEAGLPLVSVVVPTFNDTLLLRHCLAALGAQTYTHDRYEVIVVDNNSTEDIRAVVPSDVRFHVIRELRRGSYAARNAGIAAAGGEIFAFTDADCVPKPDWLLEGVRALQEEPEASMVGGRILLRFAGRHERTGSEIYEARHAFQQEHFLLHQRFAATANMIAWRRTFEQIGLFDDSLMSGGDMQWGRRVAAAGGYQRFAPRAAVEHPARARLREVAAKALRVERGHQAMALAAPRPFRAFSKTIAHQLRACTLATLSWRAGSGTNPVGILGELRYLGVVYVLRTLSMAVAVQGLSRHATRRCRVPSTPGGPTTWPRRLR